jgi:two-component system C4-dicarboxylate transport response regulator DctD
MTTKNNDVADSQHQLPSCNDIEVVVIDDERHITHAIEQLLDLEGYKVRTFSNASQVLPLLSPQWAGIILSDINMPVMDGLTLLSKARVIDPDLPVILLTGFGDISMAVQAMRDGAYDFIEKPFDNDLLLDVVKRAIDKRRLTIENRCLKLQLATKAAIGPRILGDSPVMEQMRFMIHQILDTPADVLIHGETGTGKELIARYLHDNGNRRDGNFVAINCGAIPENLIESELFGVEPGAYTGVDKRRIGKFEYANGGTLFLDEIESTPLPLQIKLLRVLEERKVVRLGSNKSIDLDIRIIAATKVDLPELSKSGEFRLDLYYRLNLLTVNIPPLRNRCEDIPLLFSHFARVASARYMREQIPINQQHLMQLRQHDWPGNVRELRNLAERYVLLGADAAFNQHLSTNDQMLQSNMTLQQRVGFFEKSLIQESLSNNNGCIKDCMHELSLPRKTLYDKIKKYHIERKEYVD